MSLLKPSPAAGGASAAVAASLPEAQLTALRSYLLHLTGQDAGRTESVLAQLKQEVQRAGPAAFEDDDPSVWLFMQGRLRVMGVGQRSDRLAAEPAGGREEEAIAEGEDLRLVVHQAIQRLTPKQQEALRLKFQFGFHLEELARITGLSSYAAGGLLHLAVSRIGQAITAANGTEYPRTGDQHLTAFALDEMDAAERKDFVKNAPNGKAVLEGAEMIRAWCGQIGQVLESGAQLPKRRRRRKGAPWWKHQAFWAGLVVLPLIAGGVYWMRQPGAVEVPKRPFTGGANGIGSLPTAGEAADEDPRGGVGFDRNTADLPVGDRPERRAPEAWETKPFGQGSGVAAGGDAGGGGGPAVAASGGNEVAGSGDGSTGRGVPLGAANNGAQPAEPRGLTDDTVDAIREPDEPQIEDRADGPMEKEESVGAVAEGGKPRDPPPQNAVPPHAAGTHEAATVESVTEEQNDNLRPKAAVSAPLRPGIGELKRRLAGKRWPAQEDVHPAEFLKHAPPPAPAPGQTQQVEAQLEQVQSPWDPTKRLVRVSLRAKDLPAPARPAANLVFAIDVSQSMAGSNRLPLVQEGIRRLLDRLRPDDRVSVVTYAGSAQVALPATSAARGGELRACLAGLATAGLTNGSEGLELAYATARQGWIEGGLNEVVLCTDGNFNLGTTDGAELAAWAAAEAKRGTRLSVFGFGRNDRNDLRLELLATSGGGRSCYVNTQEEAEQMLVGQINGLFAPVATGVRLTVEFRPELVAAVRQLDRDPAAGDPTGGTLALLLPGRALTAWYEITPAAAGTEGLTLAHLRVEYVRPESGRRQQLEFDLTGNERAWTQTQPGFRHGLAMIEFARILRGRPAGGIADLARLEDWVQANLTDDAGGYRAELLFLLEQTKAAAQGHPAGP